MSKKPYVPKDMINIDQKPGKRNNGKTKWKSRNGNHDSWYAHYPTLTKNVGTLPFVWALGPRYSGYANDLVPSVMLLNTTFTPGILKDGTDPLNVADRYAWNNQRATNAGYNYTDPQDVGQIWFSIANAHAFFYWARRIYGTLRMFNPMNRFFPRYALESAFIDYDDLRQNMALLRSYLNQFSTAMRAFPVPSEYSIVDKYEQLMSNYYGDVDAPEAQIYAYEPNGFWRYDEANGQVVYDARGNIIKYADIVQIGDTLLSALQQSETVVLLCGNTIKSYQSGQLRYLPEVEDNYIVAPAYNERVLITIQNTICTGVPDTNSLIITQSPGDLDVLFDPTFTRTPYDNVTFSNYELNIPKDNITPEDVLATTADMVFMYVSGGTSVAPVLKLSSCGSEIITSFTMCYLDATGAITRYVGSSTYILNRNSLGTAAVMASLMTRIMLPQKFDWHPRTWVASYNSIDSTPATVLVGISDMDVSKYTVIQAPQLNEIHKVRLLNYYATPEPTFK